MLDISKVFSIILEKPTEQGLIDAIAIWYMLI